MAKVLVLIGTKKGTFILESDEARRAWSLKGPFCATWPIQHVIGDPETGTIYAAGGNAWFGGAIWKSTDLGETWTHSSEGLTYGEGETPIAAAWSLRGFSRAPTTARLGRTSRDCASIPRASTGSPAAVG